MGSAKIRHFLDTNPSMKNQTEGNILDFSSLLGFHKLIFFAVFFSSGGGGEGKEPNRYNVSCMLQLQC